MLLRTLRWVVSVPYAAIMAIILLNAFAERRMMVAFDVTVGLISYTAAYVLLMGLLWLYARYPPDK